MRYAIVRNAQVENIILWDGEEDFEPPVDTEIFEITDEVSIGWLRIDNSWTAPELEELVLPEDPTYQAKLDGVQELMAIGLSENTARAIFGLPELEQN